MCQKTSMQNQEIKGVITLTSDWGTKDYNLASVRGKILCQCPNVNVIDLSHDISSFNLSQTVFILENSYRSFPKGTVHIVSVGSEPTLDHPHVLISYDGYYFIGTDNGMFSLLFDKDPELIIEIDIPQDSQKYTFPTRDVFIKVAAHVLAGKPLEVLGEERSKLTPSMAFRPTLSGNTLIGKVIYIDRYENVITNIKESYFEQVVRNKKFDLEFGLSRQILRKICSYYKEVPEGEALAIFTTGGFLSIAINQGNASSLLGLSVDDTIRIEYKD